MQSYLAFTLSLFIGAVFNEPQMKSGEVMLTKGKPTPSDHSSQSEDYLYRVYTILQNGGDPTEAIRLSNIAISLQDTSTAYIYRAFARNILDDKSGAVRDYTNALQIDPNNKDAFLNRGLIKSSQGNRLGAIIDFDRAIQIDPSDGKSFDARAYALMELGRDKDACRDYMKAVFLNHEETIRWFHSVDSFWCRGSHWLHPSALTANALHVSASS